MKSRSRIIAAFLLCACLIVGVGYAELTENLLVDGTLEYYVSDQTGLEGKLYFTGSAKVVKSDHTELNDSDVAEFMWIIVDEGDKEVDVTAQFTTEKMNDLDLATNSSYVVGIVLEVKIDNTSDTVNPLTIEFDEIVPTGSINPESPRVGFHVNSSLKEDFLGNTDVTSAVTVPAAGEKILYLHVQISLPTSVNEDISAPFTIPLRATKVTNS